MGAGFKRAASLFTLAICLPIAGEVWEASVNAQTSKDGPTGAVAGTTSGLAGSTAGSPGMADDESACLADVRNARLKEAKQKTRSLSASTGALIALGMHYNRKEQFSKACKAFEEASKQTSQSDYQTLEQLLPPMIDAESECKQWKKAEAHAKRLIELARNNQIHQFPGLMFALRQYTRILSATNRPAEAARYKAQADNIDRNIKGL